MISNKLPPPKDRTRWNKIENNSKKKIFYVIEIDGDHHFIGFGVTSNLMRRLNEHARSLSHLNCRIVKIKSFTAKHWLIAQDFENSLRNFYKDGKHLPLVGFITESISWTRKRFDFICHEASKLEEF